MPHTVHLNLFCCGELTYDVDCVVSSRSVPLAVILNIYPTDYV
jgi:hypothetical protein